MFDTYIIPTTDTGDCMFAEYFSEREDKQTVFHAIDGQPVGFATYKWVEPDGEPGCYIVDIYVKRPFREINVASRMADEIASLAREKNCKWLWGSVDSRANGADTSKKVLVSYGFDYSHDEGDLSFFRKHLEV